MWSSLLSQWDFNTSRSLNITGLSSLEASLWHTEVHMGAKVQSEKASWRKGHLGWGWKNECNSSCNEVKMKPWSGKKSCTLEGEGESQGTPTHRLRGHMG